MNTTTMLSISMLESINAELRSQVMELTPPKRDLRKQIIQVGAGAISLLAILIPLHLIRL